MPSVATVRHWRRRRRRRPEAAVAHEAPEMPPRAACKPHCLAQRRTIIAHFFQLLRKLGLLGAPPPPLHLTPRGVPPSRLPRTALQASAA